MQKNTIINRIIAGQKGDHMWSPWVVTSDDPNDEGVRALDTSTVITLKSSPMTTLWPYRVFSVDPYIYLTTNQPTKLLLALNEYTL